MVEILSGIFKQRSYFLNDGQISGYFDTKYITVYITNILQILHNFKDQKIANSIALSLNRSISCDTTLGGCLMIYTFLLIY